MIDFNGLIDKYLEREFKPKTIGRYYPSEVGSCLRKTWFSYKIPKQTDTALMRIFEAGNMLHEFITEVIKSDKNDNVELIKEEMPVQIKMKDFTISGRIDNLVLLKVNNKEVLVEVKSTKFLPKDKKKEHEIQLQLYMRATGIEDGMLLYIQKDNLQTISFPINYDVVLGDKIIERFELLHESLMSGVMPEAEAKNNEADKWLCGYCAYEKECGEAGG